MSSNEHEHVRVVLQERRDTFLELARARIRMRDLDGLRRIYQEHYPTWLPWTGIRERLFSKLLGHQSGPLPQLMNAYTESRAMDLLSIDEDALARGARALSWAYVVFWCVAIALIAAAIAGVVWVVS